MGNDVEETILEAAKSQLVETIMNELSENVDSIKLDAEVTFDQNID